MLVLAIYFCAYMIGIYSIKGMDFNLKTNQ